MERAFTDEILAFFTREPRALPLFEAVMAKVCAKFVGVAVRVSKTQIAFANKYNFAFVSLPYRRAKGDPEVCIILTFGLSRRAEHPRIRVAVEPYPNRWTHHVCISDVREVDDQVMAWVGEAYSFSMSKK